jgi:hypothetical protein
LTGGGGGGEFDKEHSASAGEFVREFVREFAREFAGQFARQFDRVDGIKYISRAHLAALSIIHIQPRDGN